MTGTAQFLLPVDAYTSDAWFAREQRALFAHCWNLVAHVDQVAAPGDWLAARAGGVPIILLRHADGDLRAFHNMCRHRGMVMRRSWPA
jgi:choline monooxygenase